MVWQDVGMNKVRKYRQIAVDTGYPVVADYVVESTQNKLGLVLSNPLDGIGQLSLVLWP